MKSKKKTKVLTLIELDHPREKNWEEKKPSYKKQTQVKGWASILDFQPNAGL